MKKIGESDFIFIDINLINKWSEWESLLHKFHL